MSTDDVSLPKVSLTRDLSMEAARHVVRSHVGPSPRKSHISGSSSKDGVHSYGSNKSSGVYGPTKEIGTVKNSPTKEIGTVKISPAKEKGFTSSAKEIGTVKTGSANEIGSIKTSPAMEIGTVKRSITTKMAEENGTVISSSKETGRVKTSPATKNGTVSKEKTPTKVKTATPSKGGRMNVTPTKSKNSIVPYLASNSEQGRSGPVVSLNFDMPILTPRDSAASMHHGIVNMSRGYRAEDGNTSPDGGNFSNSTPESGNGGNSSSTGVVRCVGSGKFTSTAKPEEIFNVMVNESPRCLWVTIENADDGNR